MHERNRSIELTPGDVEKIEILGRCAHQTPLQLISIFLDGPL